MRNIVIKNLSEVTKTYLNVEVEPQAEFIIPMDNNSWIKFASSQQLIHDITEGLAQIGNGLVFFDSIPQQLNHLRGNLPQEIIPTSPKNEHCLEPTGATKGSFIPQDRAASITLSDVSEDGLTFTYSCSLALRIGDYVFQDNFCRRSWITAIDTQNSKVTFELPVLEDGAGTYTQGYYADTRLPDWKLSFYLWGALFSASNYSINDFLELAIVDRDHLFELDAVTQSVFGCDAVDVGNYLTPMGFEFSEEYECWTKYYDESWVSNLRSKELKSPDGAPGETMTGLYLRVSYFTSSTDTTRTDFFIDYNLTSKDS